VEEPQAKDLQKPNHSTYSFLDDVKFNADQQLVVALVFLTKSQLGCIAPRD